LRVGQAQTLWREWEWITRERVNLWTSTHITKQALTIAYSLLIDE
jgi:hypothetical protein